MCALLNTCIEDYAEKVQNWLVENQWMNLYGKNITSTDMAYALSVRTFDMAQDYSYYFSKEVGLQQRGPWELKKDFIEIEPGKQVYIIPAGHKPLYLPIMLVLMLALVVDMLRWEAVVQVDLLVGIT